MIGAGARAAREAAMAKAQRVEVTETFHQCPRCGYQNGFHVGLKQNGPNGGDGKLAVHLICPSCSAVFDVGLRMALPSAVPAGQ